MTSGAGHCAGALENTCAFEADDEEVAPPVSAEHDRVVMQRSPFFVLVVPVLAAASACFTPTAAGPTTAAAPDPEVVLLRERVARLERRLVDVDSRLALVAARTEISSSVPLPRSPLRFDLPRGPQQPMDLEPAGMASIDLDRGAPPAEVVADVPIADDSEPPAEGLVAIGVDGDDPGAANDDDPLGALSSAADLYAWGQTRLKEGRHIEAIAAFEDVIGRFPTHDLADNSLYWIGWAHQQRGDHLLAIAAWQKLPARFPRSAKVPDGLFGMAQSHEALGEPAVAEALYDEVVSSYPKAEKLKDAKRALQRLRPH